MAEEKHFDLPDTGISTDDMSVLRTLMHNIKGLSIVSTVDYAPLEETVEE